jgi:hypothetical protein
MEANTARASYVASKESIESVTNFDAAKDLQKLGYAQELTRVRERLFLWRGSSNSYELYVSQTRGLAHILFSECGLTECSAFRLTMIGHL